MLQLIALGIVSSWLLGGSAFFAQAFLVGLSWLGIIFYFHHVSEAESDISLAHRTLILYLSPFLLSVICFIIGAWNQPVGEVILEGKTYLALKDTTSLLPTTILPRQTWLPLMLSGGLYLAGVNLLLVVKAEDVMRRILLVLCISAAILAFLGCVQAIIRPDWFLGIVSIPTDSQFSVFPHPHAWASFALLWSAAMLGMCSHYVRHIHIALFLDRGGVWFIAGTTVLMATVVISGTGLHILLLTLLLALASFDIAKNVKSPKRSHKRTFFLGGLITIFAGTAAVAMSAKHGTMTAFDLGFTELAGITWAEQSRLMRDTWELFLHKPFFGWGEGSFRTMLAFTQESDYGNVSYGSAHSDLLQALMEKGLVGMIAWSIVPLIITVKFLRLKERRPLSWYLFSGAMIGLVLGLVSMPFQFPAFTFSYWLMLFGAYQWSVIPHLDMLSKQRPELVFTESLRRTQLKSSHPKEKKRSTQKPDPDSEETPE